MEDAPRERAVIENALQRAAPLGLSPDGVRKLFELQVRTARETQARLHRQWRASGFEAARPIPSLEQELRPKLDRLTSVLLRDLYLAAPALQQPDFIDRYAILAAQKLNSGGWSDETRGQALATLASIRLIPTSVAERVRASGVIRIGTTGDYAPFSVQFGEQLMGADIELAKSLARKLGAEPVFVRTAWPTLLDDLRANKFDLAIGGISVTPAREAVASFSVPYSSGGKTILSRCSDAKRYATLQAVDRHAVRVIVNPGGTNEQYVREHLRQARVQVFPDNRAIFDEISSGRADVMITDDVEVELQIRRHPDLCRSYPGTLTESEKAILLPRDASWVAAVNQWLAPEIQTGHPARLIEQSLQAEH